MPVSSSSLMEHHSSTYPEYLFCFFPTHSPLRLHVIHPWRQLQSGMELPKVLECVDCSLWAPSFIGLFISHSPVALMRFEALCRQGPTWDLESYFHGEHMPPRSSLFVVFKGGSHCPIENSVFSHYWVVQFCGTLPPLFMGFDWQLGLCWPFPEVLCGQKQTKGTFKRTLKVCHLYKESVPDFLSSFQYLNRLQAVKEHGGELIKWKVFFDWMKAYYV